MNRVRIGFVGVGSMGQMAHLRNYIDIEDCEVAALADVRTETAKLVAQRYGVSKVYATHRELVQAEELDGIVATLPFRLHSKILPDLYGRTKNLFTEKPLALSVQAGRYLARAAAEAGCTHMVGYHKLSDPATIYAKQIIDEWTGSGEMGRLKYVRITMPAGDWITNGFVGRLDGGDKPVELEEEPLPADIDEAFRDEYQLFVNYYIHQINLMRHLLGEPYRVTYAEKSRVLLAVESEAGVPGVIEMTPYTTSRDWQETALVAFEKGYILLRLPAPLAVNRPGTVEIFRDPGNGATPQRIIPTLPWVHAMRRQAISFVKVCRGEITPPCDAAEAVRDLEVARDYIRLLQRVSAA